MNTVHISICDDDRAFAPDLQQMLETEFARHGIPCECVYYPDGASLLKGASAGYGDLIFLDLRMPGMSGLKVAQELKKEGVNRRIAFMTNSEDLVFDALRYYPFCFLRKGCLDEELPNVIVQYLNEHKYEGSAFFYSIRGRNFQVPTRNIAYLSYWKHRITLVLADGETQEFRSTLKKCEEQLTMECFIRVDQGVILNLRYCESFCGDAFRLHNGKKIPVSRSRRRYARECFERYYHREL